MLKTILNKRRDRFIERTAKKPQGAWALKQYADPSAHYWSFKIIMEALDLDKDDIYCEIGCGGGALLKMALSKAGRGAAIDHSQDMIELSTENNREYVEQGRLQVVQGNAEALPWESDRFTACACANMFFFVEHPEAALAEIFRVLAPGGRFSMVTAGNGLLVRMTMGWFYRLRSYPDHVMAAMMKTAGFSNIRVISKKAGFAQVCYGGK